MKTLVKPVVLGAVVLLVGAGCTSAIPVEQTPTDVAETTPAEQDMMMEKDNTMMKDGGEHMEQDAMEKGDVMEEATAEAEENKNMEKEEPAEPQEQVMEKVQPGVFAEYSPERLAAARGDIVLFFGANWCPTCRALEKDILAKADTLPADLTILKLNYDKETELKKKYKVTTQHTLLQVDSNGKEITRWAGGTKLDTILSQLK